MTISRSEIIRIVGELESIRVLSDAELLDVLGMRLLDAPVDVWRFTCPVCWLVAGEIFYRPVAGSYPFYALNARGSTGSTAPGARCSILGGVRASCVRRACLIRLGWRVGELVEIFQYSASVRPL